MVGLHGSEEDLGLLLEREVVAGEGPFPTAGDAVVQERPGRSHGTFGSPELGLATARSRRLVLDANGVFSFATATSSSGASRAMPSATAGTYEATRTIAAPR